MRNMFRWDDVEGAIELLGTGLPGPDEATQAERKEN